MVASLDIQWEAIPLSVGETNSVEIPCRVRGVTDEIDAAAALLSLSPDVYGGLPKLTGGIKTRASASIWLGTVTYGSPTKQKEDSQQLSFKTGGGTQKIIRSLGTTRYGPKAPDMGGLINVTANGVEGVDIHVPTLEYTIRRGFAIDFVTNDYVKLLSSLTGSVNDAPFLGFEAGEVLFLGAEGTQSGIDPWQITFSFAASQNASDLTVGDITGINKNGWQYLWIRSVDSKDVTTNTLCKKPVGVYVEDVCPDGDFSALGVDA